MNILVSSAGRRGALVRLIRESLQEFGGRVFAIDSAPWSSACRLADGWQVVPKFRDEHFFDAVVSICRRHDIRLIIPTHDDELPVYAKLAPFFAELGIQVACSGVETIALCRDKRKTHEFLGANQLPTVTTIDLKRAQSGEAADLPFPLIVKPSHGSGSDGVHRVQDVEELEFYLKRTKTPIVQRLAVGHEFTTNMYVADGRCVVAVPHWRVETRSGEVSQMYDGSKGMPFGFSGRFGASVTGCPRSAMLSSLCRQSTTSADH